MIKKKIRYKTWYWGNYTLEGQHGFTLKLEGFEEYNEELHGWKNSEEFKTGYRLTPYNKE